VWSRDESHNKKKRYHDLDIGNDRAMLSLQSHPLPTERKVGPATVINIRLHQGWNDGMTTWCGLGRKACDSVTTQTTATLNSEVHCSHGCEQTKQPVTFPSPMLQCGYHAQWPNCSCMQWNRIIPRTYCFQVPEEAGHFIATWIWTSVRVHQPSL